MRIISRGALGEFWNRHPDAEQPLKAWFAEATKAQWHEPVDIVKHHRNARIIGKNRAVFNIKGNAYRLVVSLRYDKGIVFIRFVVTHAEYDRVDATSI